MAQAQDHLSQSPLPILGVRSWVFAVGMEFVSRKLSLRKTHDTSTRLKMLLCWFQLSTYNSTSKVCTCDPGYGADTDISLVKSADCSMRVCSNGPSWFDIPTSPTAAHSLAECSNAGVCHRGDGRCVCFAGIMFPSSVKIRSVWSICQDVRKSTGEVKQRDKTRQDQDETRQDRTRPRQDKTRQGKTRQD